MEIDIAKELVPDGVAVRVLVRLSGREANRLFLSGDTLIELWLDGAVNGPVTAGSSPIPRTTIFLSELAGLADGLTRVFADDASADRFAGALRADVQRAVVAR